MPDFQQPLKQVSMVSANFGNGPAYRAVLQDWFRFLGGKPGEVVVVDGGSDRDTQEVYWELFREGLIDKLQVIRADHLDNSKDKCFIQEYTAGSIASNPYLLWFKIDTLPFRSGYDSWLAEAIQYLDRPEIFAVSGSFSHRAFHHDAWPGWYYSRKCSENFALMKRTSFVSAIEELAGDFIRNAFTGPNPADATGQGRYLVEVAFERYMVNHGQYSVVRDEDENWTIAHTNLSGHELLAARARYFNREDISSYLCRKARARERQGVYYGRPENRPRSGLRQLILSQLRRFGLPVAR